MLIDCLDILVCEVSFKSLVSFSTEFSLLLVCGNLNNVLWIQFLCVHNILSHPVGVCCFSMNGIFLWTEVLNFSIVWFIHLSYIIGNAFVSHWRNFTIFYVFCTLIAKLIFKCLIFHTDPVLTLPPFLYSVAQGRLLSTLLVLHLEICVQYKPPSFQILYRGLHKSNIWV
jgi:hypothetical protein